METTTGSQPRVIAPVLAQMRSSIDALARRFTALIRSEAAGYEVLPVAEHESGVREQIRRILDGLIAQAPPAASDVESARTIGRARARVGLAITDVVEAYHVAYREIWNELLERVQARSADTAALTPEVGLLWNWLHTLTSAVAEAHAAETRTRTVSHAMMRRRFVDAIVAGDAGSAGALVPGLGLEPDATYLAAIAADFRPAELDDLEQRLAASGATVFSASSEAGPVLLFVGYKDGEVDELLAAAAPDRSFGIGARREGVDGAVMSVRDAADAVTLAARRSSTVRFAKEWLVAATASAADRLRPWTHECYEVGLDRPDLAATVRAFAASGFSVTRCARTLHIHPNTAAYRLSRWHAITGCNPMTFEGLCASVIGLGGEELI